MDGMKNLKVKVTRRLRCEEKKNKKKKEEKNLVSYFVCTNNTYNTGET